MNSFKKRGQVTAFIIVGVLIVATIFVFFLYVQPNFINSSGNKLFLETCVEDAINTKMIELAPKAGIQNAEFTYNYLEENITFVCYSDEYYQPCVVQHPLLKKTFENNLKNAVAFNVQKCYQDSINELRSRGYEVNAGEISFDLVIQPNFINTTIKAPTTITSDESSRSFKNFEIVSYSEIYDILSIADSIIQFETNYGDSETQSFAFYYPNLVIKKVRRDEGIKLYTISDKEDIEFKFAIRSFAWPAGYGLS